MSIFDALATVFGIVLDAIREMWMFLLDHPLLFAMVMIIIVSAIVSSMVPPRGGRH